MRRLHRGWGRPQGLCPWGTGGCPLALPLLTRLLSSPQRRAALASASMVAVVCPARPSRATVPKASRVLSVSMVSGAPSRH